jgi:hypothetical protein
MCLHLPRTDCWPPRRPARNGRLRYRALSSGGAAKGTNYRSFQSGRPHATAPRVIGLSDIIVEFHRDGVMRGITRLPCFR